MTALSIFISCISPLSDSSLLLSYTGNTLLTQHDKPSFPVCVSEWGKQTKWVDVCASQSRLDNYEHNAGLSSKSLLKQKHTRTEDNNYPSWMRQLSAHSHLSKHTDRIRGAFRRLQWVNEIWLNATEVWEHWYEQAYVSKCVAVSAYLTVFCVYLCSFSSFKHTDTVVSVCVSHSNITSQVFQETDLVFPSGLHPANVVRQSTPWQLLVPPTASLSWKLWEGSVLHPKTWE